VSGRVRERVDIAADPEDVFAFFDDLANASVLVPSLAEITNVEDLPAGGRRIEYSTFGRRDTRHEASTEHLVYDPPTRTVTRSVQSGIETTATREFIARAGGTRVVATIEWEVPVRYVSRLVSAPLRGPYRRALREALHGARAALEHP
jgi:hypothetical protein